MKPLSDEMQAAICQIWALAAFSLIWGLIFHNAASLCGAFFLSIAAVMVWSSRKLALYLDSK